MNNLTITILLAFCISTLVYSQSANKVIQDMTKTHESANYSSLFFTNKFMSFDQFDETNTIDFVKYDKNTNLFFRAFHNRPLVEYLSDIAPKLSEEELIKFGNYQFTFIVDGKIIYVENLHAGAGTKNSKSKWTSVMVPLTTKKKIDSWGRFLWLSLIHI